MIFRLLGPVEVRHRGATHSLPSRKARALLAALLLRSPHPASRTDLVRALWDEPTRQPDANLRTHLATLRRDLAGIDPSLRERVTTGEQGSYCLEATAEELDVALFTDYARRGEAALRRGDADTAVDLLQKAQQLWRGRAGADAQTSRYLAEQFSILDEQYMSALEDLADAQIALGAPRSAIGPLHKLLSDNPLQERGWGILARAQYLAGDPVRALITYERARTLIGDELGADPSPELEQVHVAILRHDVEAIRYGGLSREGFDAPAATPRSDTRAAAGAEDAVGAVRRLSRHRSAAASGHRAVSHL